MLQDSLLTPRPAWLAAALMLIARHRFLEARQVAAVLDLDPRPVAEVFDGLVAERLLQKLTSTSLVDGAPRASAFALTRAGLATLATDEPAARRIVRPLTSAFTLAHELRVNELALVLRRLDARGSLRLLSFTIERDRLACVTHINERGRVVRVPLVADALAIIEVRGVRSGLLVEIDMGTVSTTTMRRKYEGYHAWWAEGGAARRFGLSATRVVTIAPAAKRLARLRDLAIEAVDGRGSGLFWFLPHDAVDVAAPGRLCAEVAFVGKANDDRCHALLPP